MSRAVAYRHADWLSLVEPAGSFVTLPVLNRVFPNGLDRTDPVLRQATRDRRPADLTDPAARTAWIDWVLHDLLGWGGRVRSGPEVPATLTHVIGEHNAVLRPDHILIEPVEGREKARALVCVWPLGTALDTKLPGEHWSATPAERAAKLCQATGVPLAIVTDANQWRLVWAPVEAPPGSATFLASLFSEEAAVLDAFTSLLSARRFFSVQPSDTIESLLAESATAQEIVADQLGRQVRAAVELLVASISRANRERNGDLLRDLEPTEIYQGTVTVLMRLVFLLYAEEQDLLPLDDDLYARSYALSTLRDQLQAERDLHGEEPLERRSAAWYRVLALFRAIHGGLTHDTLRIPPYGGRLFDPDRYPFLEGRTGDEPWRQSHAEPIPVDDLTMLAILESLQVLQFTEGGVREARQLSYRTLEVEQIGHVYEGLLDHSVRMVDTTTLGLVGKPGDEPEVPLAELEHAAATGRADLVRWLKAATGKTDKQLTRLLDAPPGDNDRQLLAAAVDNDQHLTDRLLPYLHLLRRDLRDLPVVMLEGSIYVTQTSTRREGGVEYTTKDLADEVARYALEPLVYSPGPQDGTHPEDWKLRSSAELLDLKICDPAVGSGAILVAAGRYLADRLVEAWTAEEAAEAQGLADEIRLTARRAVADRCLYGVDRDPLAAEMAKLSLWLTTMAKDRPFTFLDHAIRVGDALLGVTDLDQIRWLHLDPAAGRGLHQSLFDWTASLDSLVKQALERRRRLAEIRVLTVRDAEDKARLTAEADADLQALRIIADLVCGAAISTSAQKPAALDARLRVVAQRVASALDEDLDGASRQLLLTELAATAQEWLNAGRPDQAPVRHALHWPLEFPEAFLDRAEPGFHFVGNPPFVGGQKITGAMGETAREYLVRWIGGRKKGSADLVAYFLLRAGQLGPSFGFLATNTVAQGDTSEVGLAQMIDAGWTIQRAVSSTPWPGRASLEIAKVWAQREPFSGARVLDGETVVGIDEMLYPVPRSGWRKRRLAANAGKSFQGSLVLGMGFTMSPQEAHALIDRDSRNADVLLPYLGGQDLNTSPTHTAPRWVVNFLDWDEARARAYPDCFAIVEEKVKPERALNKDRTRREIWWRFTRPTMEMYRRIEGASRVLVLCQTSKLQLPAFVAPRQVFSHKLVVFAFEDDFHFGVLSSGLHWHWVLRHGSSMRVDPVYTPSDVFETFPQPSMAEAVATAGRVLNEHRAELMVVRDEGLTVTYNRVHDPEDASPGIVRLRELHRNLDEVVRDAYGWHGLDLDHGFHPVRGQGIRYTFSPAAATEVLERLLELNRERYEAEVAQGLHGTVTKPSKAKKVSAPSPALFGDEGGAP